MEGSSFRVSFIALMVVVFGIFSLIGGSHAAEAPAPSPTSDVGIISPSIAAAFLVSFMAFLFGSLFR